MQERFQKHITNTLNFLKDKKLLIAISGGLDSVVLTYLCKTANLNIALAHCNFNLRDLESDADEAFVLDLAKNLELPVFIQHFNTNSYAQNNKLSTQMAARALRYNWFNELAKKIDFDYILTAHHLDDNLETFLINLSRGTGLDGLTGIPEINGNTIRPLLNFSRETIENFAITQKIEWREDSSNASTKYLRNKLRHDVIPDLKALNPQFLQNFESTLKNLNDTADIVEESVDAVLKRTIIDLNNDQITYKISQLIKLNNPKAYLVEIFKPYGFTAFNDIFKLLEGQSGKQILSQTHRLIKDRAHLILAKLPVETEKDLLSINLEDKEKSVPNGTLILKTVNNIEKTSKNEVFLDLDTLHFPLKVRKWKEGDYFYPIGLNGKKKLSKYFKDEKLSLLDKEKCLLLCSENEIVWLLNYRADARFKVTKKTNNILKIVLIK